jgi:hypothetical protein
MGDLNKAGTDCREMENKWIGLAAVCDQRDYGTEDVSIVSVFPGANDHTIELTVPNETLKIMDKLGAMFPPGLTALVSSLILSSSVVYPQESGLIAVGEMPG